MLSSWCQYESLKYVSFPAATLFKSFKLAPVMLMGVLLGNKKYPHYDYLVALLIGIGITMFMSSTDDLKVSFRYNTYEQQDAGSPLLQHTDGAVWTGVMLLFLFLFFDSFTSQWQSRMFQRHVDLSMVELIVRFIFLSSPPKRIYNFTVDSVHFF
jgi:adenosine 3'-phospho 5'-phosphosulfate transporter B2